MLDRLGGGHVCDGPLGIHLRLLLLLHLGRLLWGQGLNREASVVLLLRLEIN